MPELNPQIELFLKMEELRQNGISQTELNLVRSDISAKIDAAEKLSKADKAIETQNSDATKVFKALPDLADGLKAAMEAFKRGDTLGGSVAVVKICGTASTLLSSLAAGTSVMGPAGAAAAAVFAITSMVLKSFEPAQKSVGDTIEGKLRLVNAETKIAQISTLITGYQGLYKTYQKKEQRIEIHFAHELMSGSEFSKHDSIAHWLKQEQNATTDDTAEKWVQILRLYLHATILHIRNLIQLMSAVHASDRDRVKDAFDHHVGVHLKHMNDLFEPARGMGKFWHIGVNRTVNGDGGHLYVRQGATGIGTWKNLDGEQTSFAVAKARSIQVPLPADPPLPDDVRHVVGLEGVPNGTFGDYSLASHHDRAYLKSLGGIAPPTGTKWQELKGLEKCRSVVALPGDKIDQVYVFAIQENRVVARMVTQAAGKVIDALPTVKKKATIVIGKELEADNAAGAGETLLRLSVMPGYRPQAGNNSGATLYLLKGPESMELNQSKGLHKIQRGVARTDWHLSPPWDRVGGMMADASHLWVWIEDGVARLSHEQIGLLASRRAAESETRKAWEIVTLAEEELWTGDEMEVEKGCVDRAAPGGIADLASCSDGTLVAAFNMRLYSVTPGPAGKFSLKWKKLDPTAEVIRVLKEPLDFWPLFVALHETLKKIAAGESADVTEMTDTPTPSLPKP